MNGDRSALVKGIVIVGLVVEAAVIVWLLQTGNESDSGEGTTRGGSSSTKEVRDCGSQIAPGTSPGVLTDDGERIALEVPESWGGRASGSLVLLEKNNGRAMISAGMGPVGGLTSALEELDSRLRRSYDSLWVEKRARLDLDGCRARSIAGLAVNRQGAELSFEALVVAGPEGNFAIAGFLERGSERGLATEVGRAIRSIRFFEPRSIS